MTSPVPASWIQHARTYIDLIVGIVAMAVISTGVVMVIDSSIQTESAWQPAAHITHALHLPFSAWGYLAIAAGLGFAWIRTDRWWGVGLLAAAVITVEGTCLAITQMIQAFQTNIGWIGAIWSLTQTALALATGELIFAERYSPDARVR